jgi:5-formyltetrahydrofolate cyclo-ligase
VTITYNKNEIVSMNKEEFRKKYKSLRTRISGEEVEDLSINIANNSLKLPVWDFLNYHIFLPITNKKEINTEFILHILQGKDKNIIVPKVEKGNSELSHYLLQDHTLLKLSCYGVPEPVSGIEILPSKIDVVFVPLLAYDIKGNRLGYGKGYYDRFLKKCNSETIFIGLSLFEPELEIPFENTDIPLNFCITPEGIISF